MHTHWDSCSLSILADRTKSWRFASITEPVAEKERAAPTGAAGRWTTKAATAIAVMTCGANNVARDHSLRLTQMIG